MFDVEKVAKTIKTKRIEKNMTQGDLAEKLCVSFQAVSNWERGNSMPDISKLEDLCKALDISVNALLGIGEEAPEQKPQPKTEEKTSLKSLAKIAEHTGTDNLAHAIENDSSPVTDIEGLFSLIEYLPDKTVANIINRSVPENLKKLSELIEDFGSAAREVYVARCIEENEISVLLKNAEFLSAENLELLTDYLINVGKTETLSGIYEFLPENLLCKIAKALIEEGADEEAVAEVYDYI